MVRSKAYVSQLEVYSEYSLGGLNPKLMAFANRISSLAPGPIPSGKIAFEPTRLTISPSPEFVEKPWHFSFERKEGLPFSEWRYFSQAPVQTDVHLELLEELEKILA